MLQGKNQKKTSIGLRHRNEYHLQEQINYILVGEGVNMNGHT